MTIDLAKWIGDYGAFTLGGVSFVVSGASFWRSGKALRLGGADVQVLLTSGQAEVVFKVQVVNQGRAATTVDRLWVEGEGGARVEAESGLDGSFGAMVGLEMNELAWDGPSLGSELASQSTATYTLGAAGTYWAMATDTSGEITQDMLTRAVRVGVLLGNGRTEYSGLVTYNWPRQRTLPILTGPDNDPLT